MEELEQLSLSQSNPINLEPLLPHLRRSLLKLSWHLGPSSCPTVLQSGNHEADPSLAWRMFGATGL